MCIYGAVCGKCEVFGHYIQNKETEFVEMYERLDDALLNGTIKQTDTITGLQNLAEKHNISFLILEGISGEDIDVITNVRDMNLLKNQLMGSSFESDAEDGEGTGKYEELSDLSGERSVDADRLY